MRRKYTYVLFFAVLFFISARSYSQKTTSNVLPDWAFGGFVRPTGINPIIAPDTTTLFLDPMTGKSIAWEGKDTFNPGASIKDGKVVILYRAEDNTGVNRGSRTSRIGYAESKDGLHFQRNRQPVIYPGNDDQKDFDSPGGCEDPRVAVTRDGLYVVFYTEWNRKVPRLGMATSKDLLSWKKYDPLFRSAFNGKFHNMYTKSASILTCLSNGRQVIEMINGKYWLYWGEHNVYAATSSDLLKWDPVVDDKGELKILMSPRKGYFDSHLTECGPPALMTDKGIILFYNGKNLSGEGMDKRFAANSYCAGQALFDSKNPAKLIDRLDAPFLRPIAPFEKSGQYVGGTVFIEGMTYFKRKWYLYYGCADSRVGVAIFDPDHPAPPDPIGN